MSSQTRDERKKEHIDGNIAKATIDKGLMVVLTGNGKGKSSSAFGMLARSVGHGLRCGVVQFIKGTWDCGEQKLFQHHQLVDFFVMATGFTWETQDREADIAAADRPGSMPLPRYATLRSMCDSGRTHLYAHLRLSR